MSTMASTATRRASPACILAAVFLRCSLLLRLLNAGLLDGCGSPRRRHRLCGRICGHLLVFAVVVLSGGWWRLWWWLMVAVVGAGVRGGEGSVPP